MRCETPRPFPSRRAGEPSGEKKHVRAGQGALSVAPRHLFDDDRLTARAIDAPHRVKKKNQEAPERDELEAPFGQSVVSRRAPMASRADSFRTHARTYGDLDTPAVGAEAGLPVNESRKTMASI